MRRAAIDVAILLCLAALAWLAHDYYIVRQHAFNGQAAAEYIERVEQAQRERAQTQTQPPGSQK